jgi:hypothetical protein
MKKEGDLRNAHVSRFVIIFNTLCEKSALRTFRWTGGDNLLTVIRIFVSLENGV